jgi:agmatine deiminase
VRRTIWLGRGCAGDCTNGHVDNVARFVAPDVMVLAYEPDPADANHERSADNLRRLELAGAADGRLSVVRLPFPRPLASRGERLPASYANFYIANGVVLLPTFNDRNDPIAMRTLGQLMPDRRVVGIPALQLLLGRGTLHCITKEQPNYR